MLKKEIRLSVLEKRRSIPRSIKILLDKEIEDFIIKSKEFQLADTVLTFVSTSDEVSTKGVIKTALDLGKTVAVPSCDYKEREMSFIKIKSQDELTVLKHGIYEPEFDECKLVIPNTGAVCIVPGLAFDRNGYRIGYGMGFYDKYLRKHDCIFVGVCYSEFIFEKIKSESHDVAVNKIVTENGFLTLN